MPTTHCVKRFTYGIVAAAICVLGIPALAGCGDDQDVAAQNSRVATELFSEMEGASTGSEDSVPRDVNCVQPKPGRYMCTAYVAVREDVALIAEYRVRECEAGWRARLISAPNSLRQRLPASVQRERDPNFDCAWR
jgi:hypothetical protein